jgi:uncharacterized membrane protein YkvA (DUF1232 family)
MQSSYKNIPPVVWYFLGVAYFICPLDLDFIFPIGYIDDAIVMYMAYKKWKSEAALQAEERKALVPRR